jgi:dTDP-4-dehydrorhamnose 3,5-epimerase
MYCAQDLHGVLPRPLAQINRSLSSRAGTLRGMHFQYQPKGESKLVSCLRGAMFDVIVDIRAGSPSYLQWHAEELRADSPVSLLVPPGFAHGFQTLSDDTETLYR